MPIELENADAMSACTITRAAILRLYPTREQAASLRRWQGGLRYVWNSALDCVFTSRDINGRWPTKAEIQALIVGMKKMEGTEWVSDIPAHALLTLADDLHKALLNWFNSLSGKRKGPKVARPRFRGKFDRAFSVYMVNQATLFGDVAVKLPKLGQVKFRCGDLPAGRILSSRIYREADKWYMASIFECTAPDMDAAPIECVGIDMGLKTLATVFDGERIREVPKLAALRRHEQRLRRYQRRLSRRVKGSKRRERAKQSVAKLHQRIANMRKDYAHKASSEIVAVAQTIKIETLNVRGWLKNRSISKSTADASVGMFLNMLRYKAAWAGRTLVEVGQWEPTSKTCSDCGEHSAAVVLGVSRWACRACGAIHDRDHNAAKNIYAYGEERQNVTGNTVESAWTGGDQAGAIRPVPQDETRMSKRAAHDANHALV
jgi:putative transposase